MIMATMRRRRDGEDDPPQPSRHTDRLLTLDRALLLGIFATGGWVASADFRQADLKTRVEQLEQRGIAAYSTDSRHDQELAVIRAEMSYVRETVERVDQSVNKLADATVRLVNRLKDSDGVR